MLNEAQTQFTMEISIDKTALGDPVIYVDGNRAGKTYTFGDFASACDALEDWKQIAQVIIPTTGVWRHVGGFQHELKERKDRKKSEQTKLAQRLARIRASIVLGARQRYQFEGEESERYKLFFAETSRMTEAALKEALKNEDMTLVAAQAKAKAQAEVKAELRLESIKAKGKMMDEYQTAQAQEKPQVIKVALSQGRQADTRLQVLQAISCMGQAVPAKPVLTMAE
jgi:hypothetical protein